MTQHTKDGMREEQSGSSRNQSGRGSTGAVESQYAELARLAREAGEGPWSSEGQRGVPGRCVLAQVFGRDGRCIADLDATPDPATATARAAYIAAASPDVVLGLLEENERLREALAVFAAIEPSDLYPRDGSEAEPYAIMLHDPKALGQGLRPDFTGADLAAARAALEQTPQASEAKQTGDSGTNQSDPSLSLLPTGQVGVESSSGNDLGRASTGAEETPCKTGWLIEPILSGSKDPRAGKYWTPYPGQHSALPLEPPYPPCWTDDHLAALRFARKQDADTYIASARLTGVVAVEHAWENLPRPLGHFYRRFDLSSEPPKESR